MNTLPFFSQVQQKYKTQDTEATVTILKVLAVMAVSVVTVTPPFKLNPPFSVILIKHVLLLASVVVPFCGFEVKVVATGP